jgi:urease accessory protein
MDTVTEHCSASASGISGTALLKLLAWLSPSFPVGAYSYSHGIEYAVEVGLVRDSSSLRDWLETLLCYGTAQIDAVLLARCFESAVKGDDAQLLALIELGDALRGSKEMVLESRSQGMAFWKMLIKTWPAAEFDHWQKLLEQASCQLAYPLAVALAAAAHRLPLKVVVQGFLHGVSANLISAGVRLVPLGQSAGQLVTAELEEIVLIATTKALGTAIDAIGSATPMVDWTSMSHETQYTRLFRS